jgi:hypothetical protein
MFCMLAELLAAQPTSANGDLGRRRLPTPASIAMAYGKWQLVDSTRDAASRNLSCTTQKSVWQNNERTRRSGGRPMGKKRRPYQTLADTRDVACGLEELMFRAARSGLCA